MGSPAGPERARGVADVVLDGSDRVVPVAPGPTRRSVRLPRAASSNGRAARAPRPVGYTRADLLPTVGTSFGTRPPLAPDPRSYRADPAGRTGHRSCCA